jgi:hypothetical protein
MRNFRYANSERTVIQAEDDAGNTLNIPADGANRHFREVSELVDAGQVEIAAFTPDPRAAEGEKLAKLQKRFWAEIAAGEQPIETILEKARGELSAAGDVKGGRQ